MSVDTFAGRKAADLTCSNLNQAVGVDSCADGSYCIDPNINPTRCVDLLSDSTCY